MEKTTLILNNEQYRLREGPRKDQQRTSAATQIQINATKVSCSIVLDFNGFIIADGWAYYRLLYGVIAMSFY